MVNPNRKRCRDLTLRIMSQNARGCNEDKMKEFISGMKIRGTDVCTITETWITDTNIYTLDGYTVISYGLPKKICKRGSLGVAIILAPRANLMWKETGNMKSTLETEY